MGTLIMPVNTCNPPMKMARVVPVGLVPTALGLALACASCAADLEDAGSPPEAPVSVLLITLDTTRADALSCYAQDGDFSGEFRSPSDATPHLDALAARGVRYRNATSVAPLTLPAHASMLTGQIPPTHGIRENGLWGLPPEADSLPEMAASAGLRTAGFVSSVVLDRRFGLDQGFEVYDQPQRPQEETSSHYTDRPAEETVAPAIAWLRDLAEDERAFTWVHLFDPHQPYLPHAGSTVASDPQMRLYQGEVTHMDAHVGRLIKALEESAQGKNTLVIVAADHGESLGEHGEWSHAALCYEAALRVPFLVVYPNGYRAGEVSDAVVSLVDVAATAREAMGLSSAATFQGDSHSLYGRQPPPDRKAYFESFSGNLSFGWAPIVGQRSREWKVSLSSTAEVFHLSQDRGEQHNLADTQQERLTSARAWLGATLASAKNRATESVRAGNSRDAADLAALGYTAAGAGVGELPDPLHPGDLPAPQESTQEYQDTLRASALQNEGHHAEAQRLAHRIVLKNAGNIVALQTWTAALLSQELFQEAIPGLRRLVGLRPTTAGLHYNLGIALSMSGENDAGIESLWRSVELDLGHEAYLKELQALLRKLGRRGEFEAYARRWQELKASQTSDSSR